MLFKVFIYFTGNSTSQKFLSKIVDFCLKLLGIGTGASGIENGEKAIFQTVSKLLQPPFTVFDVGANKGQFCSLIQKHLLSDHQIHCFEPGVTTFNILKTNINSSKSVILNNFGLSHKEQKLKLYYDKPGSGLASLTQRNLDHFDINFSDSEEVTLKTLDQYCIDNSIDSIDLLKIDVEGHELDVLAGASKTLSNNIIKTISFEFGGCNIDTKSFFQEYFYFFKNNDMEIFRITPSGYLHSIETYSESQEQFRTTNFFAIKKDLLSA